MERTPPSFRHAERFAGELSPRQRDVLRLIAEGKTNGEIAEALGMTLAGAKWHVSELLSKLGLDVREEAAAFYRWQKRRSVVARGLHWLAAPWLLRPAIAAGTLAVAAIGVAIAVGAFGGESAAPEVPGRPFYLEAQRTDTRGRGQDPQVSNFRWWRQDATHERTEVFPPSSPSNVSLSVTEGADTWGWNSASGFYSKLPRPELGCAICHSFSVGPIDAPDFPTYLAQLRERDGTMRIVGNEAVLGRRTVRVERAIGPGSPVRLTEWIDPERLIVMRTTGNDPENQIGWAVEVTNLEYDTVFAPGLFVWSPPPGSVEDKCFRVNPMNLPEVGFLAPDSVPLGYTLRTFGASRDSGGTCGQAHLDYETGDSGKLQVGENREDPESVVTGPRDDPREVVPGVTAYVWEEPGYRLLAWVHDGLGVQLKSDTLTTDDLLAFGRALLAPATASSTPIPASTPSP